MSSTTEAVKCGKCKKEITTRTEVEYSEELTEYYCNYDCAVERFFDYMRCTPFQFEEDLGKELTVIGGVLHEIEDL